MPQLPAPIAASAALRRGGSPPSHSHWSSTFGQIRVVTVAASAGEGCCVRGKVTGLPTRSRTFRGRIRQPRRTCSLPCTAPPGRPPHQSPGPDDRRRALASQAIPTGSASPRGRCRRCRLGPAPAARFPSPSRPTAPRRIGKAPTRERIHPRQRLSNSSTLATYCIGRRQGSVVAITNGSRKLRWLEATISSRL